MNDIKSVAKAFYDAVAGGRPDALDAVCAPDLRGHAGAGSTLAELKVSVDSFADAFPDQKITIRHLVAEGDLVSSWVVYSGTHQGSFAGIAGSGAPVKFAAWDLMRVQDGRIVELTMHCDLFTLMNQIGALATAAPQ